MAFAGTSGAVLKIVEFGLMASRYSGATLSAGPAAGWRERSCRLVRLNNVCSAVVSAIGDGQSPF